MAARPKSFMINELIQNGWDATGTTRVDVTLTEPDANWRQHPNRNRLMRRRAVGDSQPCDSMM